MVAYEEKPRYFALAPAGYTHLEQAAYRLARYSDAPVWQDVAVDLSGYEHLGSSLHFEDLWANATSPWISGQVRPRFDARVDSLTAAQGKLRTLLRQGQIAAIGQLRTDGRLFNIDANWWAQPRAPDWFSDGSCFVVDPYAIGSNHAIVKAFGYDDPLDCGYFADLFVEEVGLSRLTNDSSGPIDTVAPAEQSAPPPPRQGRPKTVVLAIEKALREEYPDGPPSTLDRKLMQTRVEERLGRKISDDSLDRARRTAWR